MSDLFTQAFTFADIATVDYGVTCLNTLKTNTAAFASAVGPQDIYICRMADKRNIIFESIS